MVPRRGIAETLDAHTAKLLIKEVKMLDRIRHAADVAKFKADQMMRINRLQGEISNLRREIQAVREKIADAVVGLHQKSLLSHQELEDLCVAIDGLNAQIAEKEVQIAISVLRCPRHHMWLNRQARVPIVTSTYRLEQHSVPTVARQFPNPQSNPLLKRYITPKSVQTVELLSPPKRSSVRIAVSV